MQYAAEAIGAAGELAVGQGFPRVDEGDFRRAAGVEIARQDVGGEIVIARNRISGHGRGRLWLHDVHRRFLPGPLVIAHLRPTPTHYGGMTILPQPHWRERQIAL